MANKTMIMLSRKMSTSILFLIIVCSAVPTVTAQTPEVFGQLKYSELRMPESFDPITSNSAVAMRMMTLMYDPLIGIGKNNEPINLLAEKYTISEDGQSIAVEMRSDAKWHDGHPVVAQDVAFTVDLIRNPASNTNRFIRRNVQIIKNVTVLDDYHLVIDLIKPTDNPAFILGFPILPSHQNRYGSDGIQKNSPFSMDPKGGGSGKFKFRHTGVNGPIFFSRNADYYNNPAYIDSIRISIMPLYENIASSVLFGGCHLALELPPRYLSYFEGAGEFQIEPYNSLTFQYIGHNFNNSILKNKDIRKAITLGTNREVMLRMIFLNQGEILSGPYAPSDPGFNSNVEPIPFDPITAVKLLEQNGFTQVESDGVRSNGSSRLSFVLKVIADMETTNDVAVQFQSNMQNIGIDIIIEQYTKNMWQEIARNGDFDMILGERIYNSFAEISTIFDTKEIGGDGLNYTRYSNASVDSLLNEIMISTTSESRRFIRYQLHEKLSEEQPYTFLWSINKNAVFHRSVRGIEIHPFEFFTYMNQWWIDKSRITKDTTSQ